MPSNPCFRFHCCLMSHLAFEPMGFKCFPTPSLTCLLAARWCVLSIQHARCFHTPNAVCSCVQVLSGSFKGRFPPEIVVRGRIPSITGDAASTIAAGAELAPLGNGWGMQYTARVPCRTTRTIPLDKIFTKERLDLMIASDWLAGGDKKSELRRKVVALSESESMPCPCVCLLLPGHCCMLVAS